MRRMFLALVIGLSLVPGAHGATGACVAEKGESAYPVTGMTCGACEKAITERFKAQAAVESVSADHKAACLKVKWKTGQVMDDKQVAEQLKQAGYKLGAPPEKKTAP